MCGFAGEFLLGPGRADLATAERMADRLAHRGPDEQGRFLSSDGRCAIGFRRLAVIDPAASHQPMTSADGRVTVAFNGEIYNFRRLREDLVASGAVLRTSGDTEVLLHMYERHGPAMLEKLDGMLSLALYDAASQRLLLARDRLGEKPLWYAVLADRIVFASEAKALLAHPLVDRRPAPLSLVYYAMLGYIPAPYSGWAGIHKLLPAHLLMADSGAWAAHRYWEVGAGAPEASGSPQASLRERARHELAESVRARMVADVPLGALLSGGVDSSIVVALMSKAAGRTGGVKTFTAGFVDARYDERTAGREIAEHCGTDHTELLVQASPAEVLGAVVRMYDEPFGDSSALPTWLICRAARQSVTVALTGDGGDEVFGGYDRYRAMHLAATMSPAAYASVRLAASLARPLAGVNERGRLRRLVRFSEVLTQAPACQYLTYRALFGPEDLGRLFCRGWAEGNDLDSPAEWFFDLYEQGELPDEVARAQRHDLLTYLPDDLLVKTDIASMASSLELRAPMLDHRLVSLGLSLPVAMKVDRRRGKLLLREAFSDLLPPSVFRRPKRGFGVPLGSWLRGELRGMMIETLTDPGFVKQGIFDPASVAGLINDHLRGRADHGHRLWALLVLARWLAQAG